MLVIDPMHNLFLGTGKSLLERYAERLSKEALELITETLQQIQKTAPHDLGMAHWFPPPPPSPLPISKNKKHPLLALP
jgi:hypothetical protein